MILLLVFFSFSPLTWRITTSEIAEVNLNRSRYAHYWVAKILENKGGIVATKFIDRVFKILDINRYLFAGHPREGASYARL